MTAAHDSHDIRFAVLGVDHPHSIELAGGLLGAGAQCLGWADTALDAAAPPSDEAALFAACFPDLSQARGTDLLAERPDLVVIAAIPNQRAQLAIEALEAGAHVLVDKPGATGLGQLAEIEAATGATGRHWWVAFTEHFMSRAVLAADRIVATGRIGAVRHVLGTGPHRRGATRPSWFTDPLQAGPLINDLASHQIHHAARLLGSTDLTVAAARTTAADGNTHPPRLGEVLLEGGTGSAYCRVDWLTPAGLPTWGDVRLMITGDHGTIEVRSNVDPAGQDGSDHLIVVDGDGVERIQCQDDDLPWAADLLLDIKNGTERTFSTAHSLAVSRLALTAADIARR